MASRTAAKSSDVSTDWERSAGQFQCLACGKKRLPAAAFGKAQVLKAQKHPDMAATCKECTQAAEERKATGTSTDTGEAVTHACSSCKEELAAGAFSRAQLTQKGPGKQRCKTCVLKAEEAEAEAKAERDRAAQSEAQTGGATGRLLAAIGESNAQAARVTGLKARPAGSARGSHQKKVEAAKARREAQAAAGKHNK